TAANVVRLLLVGFGVHPQFAALTAGVMLGLIAALVATRARVPRITVSVPASLIMIPGTARYRAMYRVNTAEIVLAMATAESARSIVVYIGAGLAIARMLTDRDWAFGRLIDCSRKPAHLVVAEGGTGRRSDAGDSDGPRPSGP